MIAQSETAPHGSENLSEQEDEEKIQEIHQHSMMGRTNLSNVDLSFALHNRIAPYLHYASKKSDGLRKGKWTVEEERYTNKIIEAFNAGTIDLPETSSGITLRAYLSEKLGCDPMRITKKYTGTSCLGKRVYHCDVCKASPEVIEKVKAELAELEYKFKDKLEQTTREKRESELTVAGCDYQNHVISTPAIDAMMHGSWAYNMNMLSGMGLGLMGGPMGGPLPLGFPMQYMTHAYPQMGQAQNIDLNTNSCGDSFTPSSPDDMAVSSNSVSPNGLASSSTSSRLNETASSATATATSNVYSTLHTVNNISCVQPKEPTQEPLKHLYPVFNHDAYMNIGCFNPAMYSGGMSLNYPYPLGLAVPQSHVSLPMTGNTSGSVDSKKGKSINNNSSAHDSEKSNSVEDQNDSKECDNDCYRESDYASDESARKRPKPCHSVAAPGCSDGRASNGTGVDSSDATSSESSSSDEGRGQGHEQSVSEYSYNHRNKISNGSNKQSSLQVPTSCGPPASSYPHCHNRNILNGLNMLPFSPFGLMPPRQISIDQLAALNGHGIKPTNTGAAQMSVNCQDPQSPGDVKNLNGSIPCHWMGMPVGLGLGGPHGMLTTSQPYLYSGVPFHNSTPKAQQISVTSVPAPGQPNSTRRKNLYTVSTLNSSGNAPRKHPHVDTSSSRRPHTFGRGRSIGQNYNQSPARWQDREREEQRDLPYSSSGSLSASASSSPKQGTSPSKLEGQEEDASDKIGGMKSFPTSIAGEDQDAATSLIFFSQIQQRKSAEFSASTMREVTCTSTCTEADNGPEIVARNIHAATET